MLLIDLIDSRVISEIYSFLYQLCIIYIHMELNKIFYIPYYSLKTAFSRIYSWHFPGEVEFQRNHLTLNIFSTESQMKFFDLQLTICDI